MSPRTKAQNEQIRNKSRELILAASLELFAQQGFHGTTISQIAGKAKISKGLLYNYFDSKEDLLKEILSEAMHTGDDILNAIKEPNIDPRTVLNMVIDQTFELVHSRPNYWKLVTSLSLKEDIVEMTMGMTKKYGMDNLEDFVDLFTRLGVQDPQREAMLLGALLDGILLHFVIFPDDYPLMKMKEFLKSKIDMILPKQEMS